MPVRDGTWQDVSFSCFGRLVGGRRSRQDAVPATPGDGRVGRLQAAADPHGGAIRLVNGAVEPPGSVVIPEVMIFPHRSLAAGKDGLAGGHSDVELGFVHIRSPKNETPGLRTSSRAFSLRETVFRWVCLVPLDSSRR